MASQTIFECFLTFLLIQQLSSIIILCTHPGLLNAFTGNLGVALGGVVDDNMVATLPHLANIGFNYCFLLDKFKEFLHQFYQN